MSGKSLGGATTAAERRERVDRALRLICDRGGSWQGLAVKLAAEFGCNYKTAKRYIREAKTLIGADLPEATQAMRAYIRGKLFFRIENTKSEDVQLRAVKLLMDLSGVSAPTRAEVLVTTPLPFDPTEAYAKDPALMERALQLEKDIYDADKTLAAEPTGEAGLPGVAVPATHSEARSGGDETAIQSDDESAGGGDSSPAR